MSRSCKLLQILFFVFCFAVVKAELPKELEPLGKELISPIKDSQKAIKMAVFPLELNDGRKTELGSFLSDVLGTVLNKEEGNWITAYERNQLEAILKERDLTLQDLYSLDRGKLGDLKGVDAILTGTITKLGKDYKLLVKIIEVDTGKQLTSSFFTLKGQEGYDDLYGKILTGSQFGSTSSKKEPVNLAASHSVDVKGIRAQLDTLKVAHNDSHIGVSISLQNLENNNIYLACRGSNPRPSISSNAGYVWGDAWIRGINNHTNREASQPPTERSKYVEIAPNNTLVVNLIFANRDLKRDKMGELFSVTVYFVKLGKNGPETFPVSFRKIRMPEE